MSDVFYYKGLTCECDAAVSRLTIEGRKVPVEKVDSLFYSPESPDDKTETLRELAEKVVDQSIELTIRETARENHLAILKRGVTQWNNWRRSHPEIRPILYETNLSKRDLRDANFSNAVLVEAVLSDTDLSGANFHEANLGGADLSGAYLKDANFCRTDLFRTNLFHADLTGANLQGTQLAGTNFEQATLKNCTIYGLSAWDLKLDGADQENLIVLYRKEKTAPRSGRWSALMAYLIVLFKKEKTAPTGEPDESKIIMPDLRSAQFMYLLLNIKNVNPAFNSLTSKIVLILGRFNEGGLEELRKLQEGLLNIGYLPIIFEFERPDDRTYTETVKMLAGLSLFVVMELSGSSVPQELQAIVPDFMIPFVPILKVKKVEEPYFMFRDYLNLGWVLQLVKFKDADDLLRQLPDNIVTPAEEYIKARREQLKKLDDQQKNESN